MTRDTIRLARPDVGEAELAAVAEVLASGQLTMGPWVGRFEQALAEAVGTADAVAVSSGTAALHLAMLALEPESMARFRQVYPDGWLINIVREPLGWYASVKKRAAEDEKPKRSAKK